MRRWAEGALKVRSGSIRLDQDVVAKFKATGPGWQSRINEVLRKEVMFDAK